MANHGGSYILDPETGEEKLRTADESNTPADDENQTETEDLDNGDAV